MYGKFNKFNSNECFRAINKFLNFMQQTGKKTLHSLDEIIAYHLDHNHQGTLSNDNHIQAVAAIKKICDTKNQTTQSNLLLALTATCYKYAPVGYVDEVLTKGYTPAKIMAAFHHETLTSHGCPMQFTAHLEQLSKLSAEQRNTLLFCIRSFAPEVVFCGNFVDDPHNESNCTQLKTIVENLTSKVSLTYTNECLGRVGREERAVFLTSISKASRLVLDGTGLHKWSANDWAYFIDSIEKNEQLCSISLNKNALILSCRDPEKFSYILKLFNVPHLKELNLHNNDFGTLSITQFQQLQKAITESPIPMIGLRYISKGKRGTFIFGGIFTAGMSDSNTPNLAEKTPEGDTSTSGELQKVECRI